MITPPPGPNWSPLHYSPPDGAGPIGPDQHWPQPSDASFQEVMGALNPLHHVPGVGMFYRAFTGETIPTPLKIAGSALFGGPLGMAGAIVMGLVEELVAMGPDLSRPSTPEGMSLSSEGGMSPVTPGELIQEGGYLTLATTNPDFLGGPDLGGPDLDEQQRGHTAYAAAALKWRTGHGGGSEFA